MFKFALGLLLILGILSGCAVAPRHPALGESDLATLIPVRKFVANRGYNGHYRLSPDGRLLAWKAVSGVQEAIFVRPVDGTKVDVIPLERYGIGFRWAQDSRHLLLSQDAHGNENFHVFMIDLAQPDEPPIDLTPFDNTRAYIQQVVHTDPHQLLIAHNHRTARSFDLYRLDLRSREFTPVDINPGDVVSWLTDPNGAVHARVRRSATGQSLEVPAAAGPTAGWRPLIHWDLEEFVRPLGVDDGEQGMYLLSNRGRDHVALTRLDLQSHTEKVIYADAQVDLSRALVSWRQRKPLAVYVNRDYPLQIILDAQLRDEWQQVAGALPVPSGLRVTSHNDAETRVTVAVTTDLGIKHYLFDRERGELSLLGASPSHEFADALAPMRPVRFASRDGLNLHGYLTTPRGVAAHNLPTVLLVHGGPWARDTWGYRRLAQFLANRGYAVLQVNYRGSVGYGRSFMQAAIGEFAGKMHDDLIDAVDWLIAQGVADPTRVAIMGGSYGGYATLVGLTVTPDTFACGIDIVGPSDLASLIESFPKYWTPYLNKWHLYVGDPVKPADRARMQAASPLHRIDAIKRPLLIVQGANDPRVKQDQSDRMVTALRAAGKPVDYLLLHNEGHGVRQWKNKLKLYRHTEDFLASCLGGRSSGFDFYQLGAWLF